MQIAAPPWACPPSGSPLRANSPEVSVYLEVVFETFGLLRVVVFVGVVVGP